MLKLPSLPEIARGLEVNNPGEHHSLAISCELSSDKSPLAMILHEQASNSLQRYKRPAESLPSISLILPVLFSTIAFSIIVALCGSDILPWLNNPIAPFEACRAIIKPGSISVPAGTRINLSLQAKGFRTPFASIEITDSAASTVSTEIRSDSSGRFVYNTKPLSKTIAYSFHFAGRTFGPDTIHVISPPELSGIHVHLISPKSSDLPDGQGDFSTMAGANARISIRSSGVLSSAKLIRKFNGKCDTIPMQTSAYSAQVNLGIAHSFSYTIMLNDSFMQSKLSNRSFAVDARPDMPPSIRITSPGQNTIVPDDMRPIISVSASDDIALGSIKLSYRTSTGNRAELPIADSESM